MNFSFSVGIPQQKTPGVKHLEKPEYIIIHTYLINYRNLKKIVKKQNVFGYQFFFKFNRKEDVYKTVVGVIASTTMNIFILGLSCW